MQPFPTISDVLKSAPFAPSLSKAHLLRLRREVLLREIPAGTSLYQKARRADHWTGVVRGVVKIHADRKSTRLNSSHLVISYAVFCLKKKKGTMSRTTTLTHTR